MNPVDQDSRCSSLVYKSRKTKIYSLNNIDIDNDCFNISKIPSRKLHERIITCLILISYHRTQVNPL